MIKNIFKVVVFLILGVSFYLLIFTYFSETNKNKINKNRVIIDSKIKSNASNLPVLENDTDNIIEFNSELNNTENKIKRNFWDLLKINE
tara:strand:+ start:257 stop:523 length:267 start_codon:yes stop_codon:yes gene_type:complete